VTAAAHSRRAAVIGTDARVLRELLRDAGTGTLGIDEIEGRLRTALGDPTLTITVLHTARDQAAAEDDAKPDPAPGRIQHSLVLDGVVLGTMTHDGLVDDAGLAEAFGVATLACCAHHTLVEQLRQTRHAAEAAINERAALERDLHDGAVQRVLSLQMGLAQARSHAGSEALATALAQLERHARFLHDDLRELSHGNFPPVLVGRGVVDALAEATLATNQRVRISGTGGRMPRPLEHALYFTALEAVQNVLAHAGTRAIAAVEFAQTSDTVVCRISDDGVGFDTEGSDRDGLGLVSMRERVTSVGGMLSMTSAPGRGTSVIVELPFPEESE
jgi:signal transduction histidine kinase